MHGMCNFEDETRAARRRAKGAPNSSHTSPIAPTATCCSCLLWFFVLLFPHDENRAFIFATPASSSLVFVVSEPCVRSTRMRGILLRAPRRRSDTAFSRFVLSRACLPFVACNELAIATKSIASVLPHAERTPWVPSNKVQRGNGDMGATRKTTRPVDEL